MNTCSCVDSRRRALLCVAAGLFASAAHAQIVFQADQRALSIEAAGSIQTLLPSAAFAPFNQTISLNVPSGGGSGDAMASQQSTISPSAITAAGMASADSLPGPSGCIFSQSTSTLFFVVTVNGPVQYDLAGSINGAQVRLADPVDGDLQFFQSDPGAEQPYSVSGILRPGADYTYVFFAQASNLTNACNGATQSFLGTYSLNATFTSLAPCPGDLNHDRVVDDADFTIFVVAYNALQCPAPPASCDADLNGDGFVDDADFVLFAAAYNALICP
jgi:hypothetical protein